MNIEHDTDSIIRKLLGMRLTKFQFGFCSGLLGHPSPSKEQRDMLARVVSRYENVMDYIKPAQTNHTEGPDRHAHANSNNGN